MNNLIYNSNIHNRNEENHPQPPKENKNKLNFKEIKNNTFKSLYEVEDFLNNFNNFAKCIKLYKILH